MNLLTKNNLKKGCKIPPSVTSPFIVLPSFVTANGGNILYKVFPIKLTQSDTAVGSEVAGGHLFAGCKAPQSLAEDVATKNKISAVVLNVTLSSKQRNPNWFIKC